jgi:hypothetical protein
MTSMAYLQPPWAAHVVGGRMGRALPGPRSRRRRRPAQSFICMMARAFLPGSMIHAIQAKPMSAMPS